MCMPMYASFPPPLPFQSWQQCEDSLHALFHEGGMSQASRLLLVYGALNEKPRITV